jgi:two-component system chemotaxis sensor kinase CheA
MADYDISPDEIPIFVAESDENLQALDRVLLILEKNHGNEEDLQTAFRAAHTLKGMAGMINHERMVAVTHAMETIFDALRKKSLDIDSQIIDACLETVDSLRQLSEEVETSQSYDLDVDALVNRLEGLLHQGRATLLQTKLDTSVDNSPDEKPVQVVAKVSGTTSNATAFLQGNDGDLPVSAEISPKSVASAARAFQLILALQEIGEITYQEPSMDVIDSALPVPRFVARVKTNVPVEEIRKRLVFISEIDHLFIGKEEIIDSSKSTKSTPAPVPPISKDGYDMLGDYLVRRVVITPDQLQSMLLFQKKENNKKLLGQLLVENGILSQAQLDDEIGRMILEQKVATNTSNKVFEHKNNGSEMTVRTTVGHLNALMNMVGELITDRNHLYQLRSRFESESKQHRDVEELAQTVAHLGRITDQLQEEVLSIRMLPISNVFDKFPRMVRDLSHKVNKKIELVIHGEDTELDRSVFEEINDPIIHMLRNSIDHGIEDPETRKAANKPEVGTITLSAQHEQGHIIITVEDDGKGIDTSRLKKSAVSKGLITQDDADHMSDEEAVNLIFLSGLSTSTKVTDISGRGVGMDIVRNNIQRINGTISVETKKGVGSKFQIILPLTLAIVPTMLVELSGTTYAFPLVMVASILRLEDKDIQFIRGKPVTMLRDSVLPLVGLSQVFEISDLQQKKKDWNYVVVVHYGKLTAGIIVDRLLGQEEVVVKSLGALIGDIQGISSAAILGDGHVALIIDVPGLLQLSGIH